ncbi:MAG: inverse autotransporter beta domain-containing protein [Hyphomicrobiales bacterium]|nr:inverse autotransporter beta domain-containing protein [Hyphomicrobiales bacterium]
MPAGGSSDYSECGKRALRNTGSRILVDTIEDALRQGGLALFEEGFQLDSSLSWVSEESSDGTIKGEIDAVIPFWNKDGHVIFTQPGLIFWKGLEEEDRVDGNFGVVYRTNLENTPIGIDAIGGASLFYDWDFHRVGHSRLGIGADIQSGHLHGAFNYYHPLSGERDGQREGFIEEALRGMDARLAFERDTIRAGARLGYWRYDGGEDVTDEWKGSIGFDAGFRIVPGVFIEGEWEKHQEDLILDQRLSLGLAFRFSLPGFEGQSYGNEGMPTNLYKIVEREKRILYEERERMSPPLITLTVTTANVGEPVTANETETAVIEAELGEPLNEDITLHIIIAETSTADIGRDGDFIYGHRVYDLDESTGAQSAPEGNATSCPDVQSEVCEVRIPAGVTRFDIEAEILMTVEREIAEFIDFQVGVPEEYAHLLQGSDVARVTINGHGNTVAFAPDAPTVLAEGSTTEIQVPVLIDKPSPMPFTLDVATSGTATAGADYRISGASLAVPENASSASLTLRSIDDDVGDGNKTIVLTLSGNLPVGWEVVGGEHTVILEDDEGMIGFAAAGAVVSPTRVFEDAGAVPITIATSRPVPAGGINLGWSASPASSLTGTGSGTINFSHGDEEQTFMVSVNDDSDTEEAEQVTVRLTAATLPAGWFLVGEEHILTIEPSDGALQFASSFADSTVNEGETVTVSLSGDIDTPSGGLPVAVSVSPQGEHATAADVSFTESQMITGGRKTYDFDIEIVRDGAGEREEMFEVSVAAGTNYPSAWGTVSADTRTMTVPAHETNFVGFEQAELTLNESGTGHNLNLRLKNPAGAPVTSLDADLSFNIALASGSADDITFTPSHTVSAGATVSNDGIVAITTVTINDDIIDEGEEVLSLRLERNAGFPANWEIEEDSSLLRITVPRNVAQRSVSFSDTSSSTVETRGNVTTQLQIDPPLQKDVTIPLTIAGNVRADQISAIAPPGASVTVSGSTAMVSFSHSEDADSVTLQITPTDDADEEDQNFTLTVGQNPELPERVQRGSTPVWTVKVTDDDKQFVTFSRAADTVSEAAADDNDRMRGRSKNVFLRFTKPVASSLGQVPIPLKVTGDPDAFSLVRLAPTGSGPEGAGVQRFAGGGRYIIHFGTGNNSVTLQFKGHQDIDFDDDVIRFEIDKDALPSGFFLGEHLIPAYTFTVTDDRVPYVAFHIVGDTPDSHSNEFGEIELKRSHGQRINVEVRISPPYHLRTRAHNPNQNNYFTVHNVIEGEDPVVVAIGDHPEGDGGLVNVRQSSFGSGEGVRGFVTFQVEVTASNRQTYFMTINHIDAHSTVNARKAEDARGIRFVLN